VPATESLTPRNMLFLESQLHHQSVHISIFDTGIMDPAQLVEIERWCEVMFVKANDPAQMAEAQRRIVPLGESAEFIPQCQYIIEHSNSSYALLIGAQSLTRLITSHWNSFTIQQRVDIRTWRARTLLLFFSSRARLGQLLPCRTHKPCTHVVSTGAYPDAPYATEFVSCRDSGHGPRPAPHVHSHDWVPCGASFFFPFPRTRSCIFGDCVEHRWRALRQVITCWATWRTKGQH
jgi:hypothetical protein